MRPDEDNIEDRPVTLNHPVQLRIGFAGPLRPIELELRLNGFTVVVDSQDDHLASAHLAAVGVYVEQDPHRGPLFPLRELFKLVSLPQQVDVSAEGTLATFLLLMVAPPTPGTPVAVSSTGADDLRLTWTDGSVRHEAAISQSEGGALGLLGIPFIASADAWPYLVSAPLPQADATVRVNLDRFLEITARLPQQIESLPIPGLWRIDGTHYGVPMAYLDDVLALPGFRWTDVTPASDSPPRMSSETALPLSEHAASDLLDLVGGLSQDRSRAVVWELGLGRRVFALAAIEALDAFPATIVCGPWALWSWRRIIRLLGTRGEDVTVIPYQDLESWRGAPPAAVVFDDLDRFVNEKGSVWRGLRRFDAALDLYRIAVSPNLPSEPGDLMRFMSVIRPTEFDPTLPVSLRYPGDPQRRLLEHVQVYLCERTSTSTPASESGRFRRSSVALIDPGATLLERLRDLTIDDQRSLVSSGDRFSVSPKIAKTVEMVRASSAERIGIVTSSGRTAELLELLLRPMKCERWSPGSSLNGKVTVVVAPRRVLETVDLREAQEVIIMDWPEDDRMIDAAVGAPNAGPDRVTILHLAGTVDDVDASLAARHD